MQFLGLVGSLLFAGLCIAEDLGKNADYLRGAQDVSSCSLRKQLDDTPACGLKESTRRSIWARETFETDPSPSSCTCNNIYFNIWSACALTNGTLSLPSSRQWSKVCGEASIPFETTVRVPSFSTVPIPEWAHVPIVGDTFDVMRAVIVAHNDGWKLIHKLAPVISSIATLVLVCLVYIIASQGCVGCRRCFSRVRIALKPSLRPVRYEEPKGDWVIDHNEDLPTNTRHQHTITRSSFSADDYASTHHHHHEQVRNFQTTANQQDNASRTSPRSKLRSLETGSNGRTVTPPLPTSKWSDSDHPSLKITIPDTQPQASRRLPGSATLTSVVAHLKNVPYSIPNPFRPRPARLNYVLPRPGFQLDDDRTTASVTSAHPTQDITSAFPMEGSIGSEYRGQAGVLVLQEPGLDNEERETLISAEERRDNHVFNISREGRDHYDNARFQNRESTATSNVNSSTVNSHIHVSSPTTTNSSVSWRFWQKTQSRSEPSTPRVPPAPSHPPPAPPPVPSLTSNGSKMTTPRFPLANLPLDESSTSTPISYPADLPQISSYTAPLASRQVLLQAPPRTNVYDPERYPSNSVGTNQQYTGSSSSTSDSAQHRRILSDADLSLGPASKLERDEGTSAPLHQSQQRQHNQVSAATSYQYTYARHTSNRRGLSDDDTASFYLTPSSPPVHLRSLSQETLHPARSNPELLFPASVRAVGYSGGARAAGGSEGARIPQDSGYMKQEQSGGQGSGSSR